MPVGTRGAVQGRHASTSSSALGAEIILANTYHLHLRPGDDLIARAGGLHAFMGWDAADPHRLGRLSGLQSRGAAHADRRRRRSFSRISTDARTSLTPESAVDIQARLGSDVAMMFDECPSWPATHDERRRRDARARCGGRDAAAIGFSRSRPAPVPDVPRSDAGPGAVRHHSGRHVQGPARPERRRHARASGSRPTPSAACRWASRSTPCTTSWRTRPRSYRTIGRAT